MLVFTSFLAFYLAWNLGANDVANSMGTSVGSKAVTLRQALAIAGILEFTGAVLFGQNVSATLVTQIVNPKLFAQAPQMFLVGMVAVLVACGVWLNIATLFGLPVSSSHATVGAIAGFGWVAVGSRAVDWHSIGIISLTWLVTPVISGAIAALLYTCIKRWILNQPNPLAQLHEWIPWLSVSLLSAFGIIVLPTISQPIQRFLVGQLGIILPAHDLPLVIGAIASVSLTLVSWQQLEQIREGMGSRGDREMGSRGDREMGSRGDREMGSRGDEEKLKIQNSKFKIQNFPAPTESLFARFQVLSACFVAFAHGSNDVGNAIAPMAAIVTIHQTGSVPTTNFQVPLWILVLGGSGIVAGLAVWGKRVITTIGENIISLQPSGGFCAELATAATVLIASQLGLPVSTSHALVGGVVGVGLAKNSKSVQFQTLKGIGLAWVVTIPIAAGLGAVLFWLADRATQI
ncbi:MAG: inorganic phosphate transporter [Leptolyngbyaceae cyanobacterium RU_5_1]|nr:inorganic phosphate transporter [Leptolyngbyaceae cyanobacterium RU_5_1]